MRQRVVGCCRTFGLRCLNKMQALLRHCRNWLATGLLLPEACFEAEIVRIEETQNWELSKDWPARHIPNSGGCVTHSFGGVIKIALAECRSPSTQCSGQLPGVFADATVSKQVIFTLPYNYFTKQYKQYIANTNRLILYCHNMANCILYCHNMRKCVLYGMYCRILFYCHIIYHTARYQGL